MATTKVIKQPSANAYAQKVIDDFIRHITDHVFCDIQNDEAKMREYMTHVHLFGLKNINTEIGQVIKSRLNLNNLQQNDEPKSWLIKSYTEHN